MPILPYMKQLRQDYIRKMIPAPVPVAPVEVPPPIIEPILPEDDSVLLMSPGTFYGSVPPENPSYGWSWVNPANNGFYVYTDPGVWTQVGTNW